MDIQINTELLEKKFSDVEKIGIVMSLILYGYRTDFEAIANKLEMVGRTYFKKRFSYGQARLIINRVLLGEEEFIKNTNETEQTITRLNNISQLINYVNLTLKQKGFNAWIQEYLKKYNLAWIMYRIGEIVEITRKTNISEKTFNLTIDLEII